MSSAESQLGTVPAYFERLVDAFHAGHMQRHAHLGHWDETPATVTADQFAAAQGRMNDVLIDLGQPEDHQRILDVGCGFGGLLQSVDRQSSGCELLGVNIDWQQLEICQELQTQNSNVFRWQEADACALPLDHSTIDVVFCVEAMFHFPSRRRFLDEAWRCLVPGGRLVVTDFVLAESTNFPEFAAAALLNDGYGPWPDPWGRSGTTAELLTAGDWINVKTFDATENTMPSYRFVAPAHGTQVDLDDPGTRAVMMLQWLHERGYLRYLYLSATKGAR